MEILRQQLTIVLDERITRTEHAPSTGERFGPKWDYAPRGQLRFNIDEWVGGSARKTWSDSERARLEGQLNNWSPGSWSSPTRSGHGGKRGNVRIVGNHEVSHRDIAAFHIQAMFRFLERDLTPEQHHQSL